MVSAVIKAQCLCVHSAGEIMRIGLFKLNLNITLCHRNSTSES